MKRQEKLQEQYEDIVFAMMMDELAAEQGRAALEENERLGNDPAAAVPDHIDRKCMQTIHNHFRMDTARRAGRVTVKTVGRLAMAFGVLSALFVGAFAISEDVRLSTMNLIVETFGVSMDLYFAPQPSNEVSQIKANWVPEGYILEDEGSDEMNSWFMYRNEKGQYIRGRYLIGDGRLLSIDTEDAEVYHVEIRGLEAMLIQKGNRLQITWGNTEMAGFIELFSNGLCEEELIQVARNVEY